MLTLHTLLGTLVCVPAGGLVVALVCRWLGRPYLMQVVGSRTRLALVRAASAVGLVSAALAAWLALATLLPGALGIALFFGLEAAALDIVRQRIRYVPVAVRS
ncbi:MAG: hypothetical protein IRY97_06755 [Thermomicrobiaceae bacterium]|nr:hypothetical protein [Thermomicrobiaceae bacterium]